MCSSWIGAVSFPWSSMRRTIQAAFGLVKIRPAVVVAVQGDKELMAGLRLLECRIEKRATLRDGQAIVLGVADHVGPTKIPRLVRCSDREKIIELLHGDEPTRACPPLEHLRVIRRHVLTWPVFSATFGSLHPEAQRSAKRETRARRARMTGDATTSRGVDSFAFAATRLRPHDGAAIADARHRVRSAHARLRECWKTSPHLLRK